MKLIPLKQAARETGVPYWRLLAWCRDNRIRWTNQGDTGRASYWVTLAAVEQAIAERTVEAVPADDPTPTLRRSRVVTPAGPSVAETLRRIRDMHKRPSSAGR
jgi:hypothetical protein